ncbi:MAG TPA: DUF6691 family protein [Solirubrobacteraceae bacterium]|nr:DUF6691 family protein [Solirubrobacteraceae bacterium]
MALRTRIAGFLIGIVFGVVLSWSGMTSPEVIREGLLFEDAYLFLFFGGAVSTAFAGLWLLKRRAPRALLTGEPVQWETMRPERRHVVGSVLFGIGCQAPARGRSPRSSARASPGASRRRLGSCSGSCCSGGCRRADMHRRMDRTTRDR